MKKRYNQRYHKTLNEGVRRKKNHREFRNKKRWRLFQHPKKNFQNTKFGNRTTN
jgi:hypothetical protein